MAIVVMNLHFRVVIDDIYSAFKPYGEIIGCRLMVNDRFESKGYAFVTFKKESDASKAIQMMNGFKMYGRKINAAFANSRTGKNFYM